MCVCPVIILAIFYSNICLSQISVSDPFQRCDLNTRVPERQHSSRLEWLTPSTTWCPTTRGAFFVPKCLQNSKIPRNWVTLLLPVFLAKSLGSYFQVIRKFIKKNLWNSPTLPKMPVEIEPETIETWHKGCPKCFPELTKAGRKSRLPF